MQKILDIITEKMEAAFVAAGYDASYGRVNISNRPDLCEYQCNGALAAAKTYKCAPIQIAKAVAEKLDANDYSLVEAVMPGFINLKLSDAFLQGYLEEMRNAVDFGRKVVRGQVDANANGNRRAALGAKRLAQNAAYLAVVQVEVIDPFDAYRGTAKLLDRLGTCKG